MVKKTSKAGTMKGYDFKVWLARNKDTLKYLLMAISGVASNAAITNIYWKWAATIVVPVLVKLGVDALDFYTSEVEL
jgi:hypothetical protein